MTTNTSKSRSGRSCPRCRSPALRAGCRADRRSALTYGSTPGPLRAAFSLFKNKITNALGCIIFFFLMGIFLFPRGSCSPQVSFAAGRHLRASLALPLRRLRRRGCRGGVRGHRSPAGAEQIHGFICIYSDSESS